MDRKDFLEYGSFTERSKRLGGSVLPLPLNFPSLCVFACNSWNTDYTDLMDWKDFVEYASFTERSKRLGGLVLPLPLNFSSLCVFACNSWNTVYTDDTFQRQ